MKKVFDFYKIIHVANGFKTATFSFVPQRGIRYNESLKWVRPERKRFFDPVCTGDLEPMPKFNPTSPYLLFQKSKELETADEKVKKIFSLAYQMPKFNYKMYEEELVQKVRHNPYDTSSLEVRIAKLTARIRYFSEFLMKDPVHFPRQKSLVYSAVRYRNKYLKSLREKDYKKFEWLLETLNLEFKPRPVPDTAITRKKSLTLLAKLKVERSKEEKLAALKKELDEKKVPFLENKIEKLKEIKAMEEKYNLPETVTDAHIQECLESLEKVKIQVAERSKRGYIRKIHPYFIEPYEEDLLLEKERFGGKIREEKFSKPNAMSEITS